jgi:hypothetical protein
MNWNQGTDGTQEGMRLEAEETLRRLASLPEPEALTGRVHARLAEASRPAAAAPVRRGFWSHWQPAQRFQFAGAAALALAVAGSTWTLHRQHAQAGAGIQPAHPAAVAPATGGFGAAGTARVPPTLNPIKVAPPPHRKPTAAHAAKPLPKQANSATPIP